MKKHLSGRLFGRLYMWHNLRGFNSVYLPLPQTIALLQTLVFPLDVNSTFFSELGAVTIIAAIIINLHNISQLQKPYPCKIAHHFNSETEEGCHNRKPVASKKLAKDISNESNHKYLFSFFGKLFLNSLVQRKKEENCFKGSFTI